MAPLHRPSLLIGAASAVVALAVVLLLATPGFAVTWPWGPPSNKDPQTVMVRGSVSCSSVTSLSDGYGGSPALLKMSDGNVSKTLHYPFKLQHSRFGSIYRPPYFTGYEFMATVPAKSDKTTIKWNLECRDQNGKAGSKHNGAFSVGRKDLSRTICSYSGLTNPCSGTEIREKSAACAFSVLTAGLDNDALSLAVVMDDAQNGWSLQDYLNSAGLAHPLVGLIVGCAPIVLPNANPAPTVKPTAAAPLPTLTVPPLRPLPTTQTPKRQTPPQAPSPPPPPPQAPVQVALTVHNLATRGATGMGEDPVPAYLTTYPERSCSKKGCNIGGTDRRTGDTYKPAVCQTQGPRTTNGNDSDPADDTNPQLYTSTRYYGVRLDGRVGYISEVWIQPSQRGGLGLPQC
ncbi:hypothetical protein [Micromonospora sp. WMMD710]|uniref:hypothetical protein n=2 Tax=unclassified Micromonospora TaxID=2617518 RepID=UPI002416DA39|nr:hypothetical protein [Micromonospora sp. WMMD710]MDG4757182.1 hypothetical protein [Micromonospora sp. WMMD710]